MGIFIAHAGQSFVSGGFSGGGLSRLIIRITRKITTATMRKLMMSVMKLPWFHVIAPAFTASAGVLNAVEPSLAARRMRNLLEKSSPPVRTLIGGMMTSLTS